MSNPEQTKKPDQPFRDPERLRELICLVTHCARDLKPALPSDLIPKLENAQSEEDFFRILDDLTKTGSIEGGVKNCVLDLSRNQYNPCKQYNGSTIR